MSATSPLRVDLGDEAIRLLRVLDCLLPDRAVVRSLLALLLLQHSRRDTRLDADGALVLLPDQDRTRWHRDEIAEGVALLSHTQPVRPARPRAGHPVAPTPPTAPASRRPAAPSPDRPPAAPPAHAPPAAPSPAAHRPPVRPHPALADRHVIPRHRRSRTSRLAEEYRLQALIAAEHATAPTAADTRWTVIADLYAQLEALTGSPVVRLARAVAVAEASGPEAGLRLLDGLDDALPRHHRVPAVRAELLVRAGHPEAAADAYRAALTPGHQPDGTHPPALPPRRPPVLTPDAGARPRPAPRSRPLPLALATPVPASSWVRHEIVGRDADDLVPKPRARPADPPPLDHAPGRPRRRPAPVGPRASAVTLDDRGVARRPGSTAPRPYRLARDVHLAP